MLFERQLTLKPDLYPWATPFIEAMHEGFWTVKKFTFDSDVTDFQLNMTEQERQMVTRALAAVAQIEIQVKTFWSHLGDNLQHPSIADLGITMANIEVIHGRAYVRLLEKLKLDNVFEENMSVPALAGRVDYLTKHNKVVYGEDARKQFIYSLILFTMFVENVSLFSQFYILLNLNRFNGVLKDTAQQVKYTRNEELLHAQAGAKIVMTLRKEYPELFDEDMSKRIHKAVFAALEAETNLIDWMVGDYEGEKLNAALLKDYVKIRLNESLEAIGAQAMFVVSDQSKRDTFWMTEGLLAPVVVDFFHTEDTGYNKADTSDDDDF